jgi:hypothetical protein
VVREAVLKAIKDAILVMTPMLFMLLPLYAIGSLFSDPVRDNAYGHDSALNVDRHPGGSF